MPTKLFVGAPVLLDQKFVILVARRLSSTTFSEKCVIFMLKISRTTTTGPILPFSVSHTNGDNGVSGKM